LILFLLKSFLSLAGIEQQQQLLQCVQHLLSFVVDVVMVCRETTTTSWYGKASERESEGSEKCSFTKMKCTAFVISHFY